MPADMQILHKEKMMYLTITSRRGHFDWAHPQNESVCTTIAINGANIKPISLVSDDFYDEIAEPDPTQAVVQALWQIDQWNRRIWFSTEREHVQQFRDFLVEHEDEITRGTIEKKVAILKGKLADLQKEILQLEFTLEVMPHD